MSCPFIIRGIRYHSNHSLVIKKERNVAEQFNATGKRKTSIARVRMEPGEGKFLVNERALKEYFTRETGEMVVLQPFDITGTRNRFDVTVNVQGGGMTGQAEAIRHGISKALLLYNQELKDALKKAGLLTRDSRIKERKKYGKRGARRRPQYSKR
jgi:small subunit ribosomal protein S9